MVKHGNGRSLQNVGALMCLKSLECGLSDARGAATLCSSSMAWASFSRPAYHSASKAIIPVRRALAAEGIPTVFNLLGPLLNPARPSCRLVGIFTLCVAPEVYSGNARRVGRVSTWAVHGSGMDELYAGWNHGGSRNRRRECAGTDRRPHVARGSPCVPVGGLRGGDRAANDDARSPRPGRRAGPNGTWSC